MMKLACHWEAMLKLEAFMTLWRLNPYPLRFKQLRS